MPMLMGISLVKGPEDMIHTIIHIFFVRKQLTQNLRLNDDPAILIVPTKAANTETTKKLKLMEQYIKKVTV